MKSEYKRYFSNLKDELKNITFKDIILEIFALVLNILLLVFLFNTNLVIAIVFLVLIILMISIELFYFFKDYYLTDYRKMAKESYISVNLDNRCTLKYLIWQVLNAQKIYKKILVDCYIPKAENKTSYINLIMITKYGVLVFKTVPKNGYIYGDEHDMYLNKNSKSSLYNPIINNTYHIKYLNNLLNLDKSYYKSLVVFNNYTNIYDMNFEKRNDTYILKRKNLSFVLNNIYNNSPEILTEEEINNIYKSLKPYTSVSKKVKSKHDKDIKEMNF